MKEGSAAAGSPSTTMFRLIKTIRQLEASISSIRLNSFHIIRYMGLIKWILVIDQSLVKERLMTKDNKDYQ
tara:strand:- start:32 stop:244 length:213 start_codon:yes stop_codon:yes gene_type:complete